MVLFIFQMVSIIGGPLVTSSDNLGSTQFVQAISHLIQYSANKTAITFFGGKQKSTHLFCFMSFDHNEVVLFSTLTTVSGVNPSVLELAPNKLSYYNVGCDTVLVKDPFVMSRYRWRLIQQPFDGAVVPSRDRKPPFAIG
jgi:hypothetical protein